MKSSAFFRKNVGLMGWALVCLSFPVQAADSFAEALARARPGDVIKVSGTHSGEFVTRVDGTAEAPITIEGDGTAVLISASKSNPVLKIQNDFYRVVNLTTHGGQKGIYVTGAHGILRKVDVSDTEEEGFTFKRSHARYWLVEDCFAHHTGLSGKYGEGFYVGDATENWLAEHPDRPGYITFYHCRTLDTVNDGWDFKEGASHVKVVNCLADMTTVAPLPASSLPYDHGGAYCRADWVQFIDFKIENLLSGRNLTAVALYQQKGLDGVMYGFDIELKNVVGSNIPQGALVYVNDGKMRATLYEDYVLDKVGTLYQAGSATSAAVPIARFKEMTWTGEGGEMYGDREPVMPR